MDSNLISSILNDVKISDSDNNPIYALKESDAPIDVEVIGALRNVIYDKQLGATLKINANGSIDTNQAQKVKKTFILNSFTPSTSFTNNTYRHTGFNNYGNGNGFNVNAMGLANPRVWYASHTDSVNTITLNYIYINQYGQEITETKTIPPSSLITLGTNIVNINKFWLDNNNSPAIYGNTFILSIYMGSNSAGYSMSGMSINFTANPFFTCPLDATAYLSNVKITCSKATDIYLNKWSSTGAKTTLMVWYGITNFDLITSSIPIGGIIETGETIAFGVKEHDADVNIFGNIICEYL